MRKKIDLTGKRFGKWLVIEPGKPRKRASYWVCKCDCGITREVDGRHLRAGNTNSCGCVKKERKGKYHGQWGGCGDLSGDFWHSIKRGAEGRKGRTYSVPFEITIEYAWKLFQKQNGLCALSGTILKMDYNMWRRTKNRDSHTASLDRIDSSKGYIKGNVQWVHKDINMMKRTYDQDYFINLCKKVASFNE